MKMRKTLLLKITASSTPLSREERDAQRRTILEELRTGAISIEEAERRLIGLG